MKNLLLILAFIFVSVVAFAQQEEYQNKLAWGIYTGIMDYCFQNK